jgi:hypothetical protein
MVPSSVLTFSTDGEHLMCGGFSHGETIYLGSIEFIVDYFGSLSLSPKRSDSDSTFMGSTHSRPPSPWRATTEDSTKEFHMASSEGVGFGLPSPRRLNVGVLPAPITTQTWKEDAPPMQSMMMVRP